RVPSCSAPTQAVDWTGRRWSWRCGSRNNWATPARPRPTGRACRAAVAESVFFAGRQRAVLCSSGSGRRVMFTEPAGGRNMELAGKLRDARVARGWSIEEVGTQLRLPARVIAQVEEGDLEG